MRIRHREGAREGLSWLGLVVVLVLIAAAIAAVLADFQEVGLVHVVLLTFVGACYAGSFLAARKLLIDKLASRAEAGWQRLLLWILALLIAVTAGTEIAARSIALMGGDLEESRQNFLPVGFALSAAAMVIDYGYEQLKRRAREFELREERSRRKAIHAELAALQARTDPHFLFNSLNTIAGLIEEDPRKATEALEKLAGIFRYALEGSRAERVSLSEEIGAVTAYLELESIRFGDRFTWRIDIAPDLLDAEVPPLFLQPLVENAVIHGIGPKRGPGRIEIRGRRQEERLHFEVEDDGAGPDSSTIHGSGTALSDLRERMELLYGDAASVVTTRGDRGGFKVRLALPSSPGRT
ncbi:MAG TPA: histidine kinase [Thermoanaerobaculia bacterium]